MKDDNLKRRKNPRLKEFNYSLPYIYFITICSYEKKDIFIDAEINKEIIKCLLQERNNNSIRLLVYCLMPNHIHLLVQPGKPGANITHFIGSFKSKTYRVFYKAGRKERVWQRRFYDHIVRTREDLPRIMEYIVNNPVRKNLTDKWDDYLYSGYVDFLE
jgi:putative transposase